MIDEIFRMNEQLLIEILKETLPLNQRSTILKKFREEINQYYDSLEFNGLECDIDGNALCIKRKDFINLQESQAVFIDLTEEQIREIEQCLKQ